jgi:vitamin B12 transporter
MKFTLQFKSMRYLFVLFLLLARTGFAQVDSILLKPVTIYGQPDEKYLSGSLVSTLDSVLLKQNSSSQISDLLALQFPIYFRNYGSGMISGISLRGTSPQHTSVLWNGININNFSLGQVDFSILPATAFDQIKIHEGAGSARYGSGAFGGTVMLNSSSFAEESSFQVSEQAGSFGRYFTSLRGVIQVNRWTFKTKGYYLESENNFPVIGFNMKQSHAAFTQKGILQDIGYQFSPGKTLSLHYWHHEADREIQPTVGQLTSRDEQEDKNDRLSIQFKNNDRLGLLTVNGGFVNDVIVFNNDRSVVLRLIGKATHQVLIAKKINAEFGGEWNHIEAVIKQYKNGKAIEDRYDLTGSFFHTANERLTLSLNFRKPFVTGFNAPFLPYGGIEYMLINRKNPLKLLANVSKNYRVPTFNDRYWQNAGSKILSPETSYAGELGYSWNHENFTLHQTAFTQQIDQWIQWVPDEHGIYRPRNVKQVSIRGSELKMQWKKNLGQLTAIPYLTYQIVRSVTTKAPAGERYTIGKQLIYTPQHTGSASLQVIDKKYSFNLTAQLNGKRYTEPSNDDLYALPFFTLLNVSASKYWLLGQHRLDATCSIKNLLNTSYQLYSGRAMPGRNYAIEITYQIKQKAK